MNPLFIKFVCSNNYRSLFIVAFLFLCFYSCVGCSSNRRHVVLSVMTRNDQLDNVSLFPAKKNSSYYLRDTIDLNGSVYQMPEGVRIIPDGGIIRNGVLLGNATEVYSKKRMFDNITIMGEWIVPEISTSLFLSLGKTNDIKNVFSLASSSINNTIHIEKGYYTVSADDERPSIIIENNTTLIMDGVIQMIPNDLPAYSILYVKGENIHISGTGMIIGDKDDHLGKNGEWGMGVYFAHCHNVSLSGLTISDCWGDCVYIGKQSNNVSIDNCVFTNSRRQGVSITSANSISITNCFISNIKGTPPGFAIDLEPNKYETVSKVKVEKVVVQNCKGGFAANSIAANSNVTNVVFSNCSISDLSGDIGIACLYTDDVIIQKCNVVNNKDCIKITDSKSVLVDSCNIIANQNAIGVYTNNVKNITVNNNVLKCNKFAFREDIGISVFNNLIICQDLFLKTNLKEKAIRLQNRVYKLDVK